MPNIISDSKETDDDFLYIRYRRLNTSTIVDAEIESFADLIADEGLAPGVYSACTDKG